jgi:hypothetical protein
VRIISAQAVDISLSDGTDEMATEQLINVAKLVIFIDGSEKWIEKNYLLNHPIRINPSVKRSLGHQTKQTATRERLLIATNDYYFFIVYIYIYVYYILLLDIIRDNIDCLSSKQLNGETIEIAHSFRMELRLHPIEAEQAKPSSGRDSLVLYSMAS